MATRFDLAPGDLATLHTTHFGKVPVKVVAIRPPDGKKQLTTRAEYVVTARKHRQYPVGSRGEVSPFFLKRRTS